MTCIPPYACAFAEEGNADGSLVRRDMKGLVLREMEDGGERSQVGAPLRCSCSHFVGERASCRVGRFLGGWSSHPISLTLIILM
jgi:hypothetical protein